MSGLGNHLQLAQARADIHRLEMGINDATELSSGSMSLAASLKYSRLRILDAALHDRADTA